MGHSGRLGLTSLLARNKRSSLSSSSVSDDEAKSLRSKRVSLLRIFGFGTAFEVRMDTALAADWAMETVMVDPQLLGGLTGAPAFSADGIPI